MWTSFSLKGGGGVRGRGDGIVPMTIVQVGATIVMFHLFTEMCHPVGGMTIIRIVGKVANGNINEYLMNKLKKTGTNGKRANIGKNKIIGVSMMLGLKRNPASKLTQTTNRMTETGNRLTQTDSKMIETENDPGIQSSLSSLNPGILSLNKGTIEGRNKKTIEISLMAILKLP